MTSIIEPKRTKVVNEKMLLVTVDISKDKHTGYFKYPDGSEMKPFDFTNNAAGFQEFWTRISGARDICGYEEIAVGFESTGPYAEPLLHYLRNKGVRLLQVNPMHTKRIKELHGNSPSKTDYKDPKVIADIIKLGHALTVVVPEGPAAQLRRLTQARERSINRRTALSNQLHGLVSIGFPEFLNIMRDLGGKTSRYLLSHYPTPQSLGGCDLEDLADQVKRISKGTIGKERVKALLDAALTSIGIREGQESIALEIREILAHIEICEQSIGALQKEMSVYLEQIPYSRYMLSIKGVGEVTAAGLIGEVGDFRKFRTISELEKLAGLDLFEISSGKHKGIRRITKRGRSLMRKILFYAAINVIRKGGILHLEYQAMLQRGKPRIKALVAISRKLLRIIFALVRNHSIYMTGYSKMSQLKEAA